MRSPRPGSAAVAPTAGRSRGSRRVRRSRQHPASGELPKGKRSRADGDKRRATPKPGLRCVAMRVLAYTAVDVSDAPSKTARKHIGLPDRSRLREVTGRTLRTGLPAAELVE